MHILVPVFPGVISEPLSVVFTIHHVPCTHKNQHDNRPPKGVIILISSLSRGPSGHAKDFQIQNGEENKEYRP